MELKLTGPKYNCLVPWYRVGSPLSIDTKIMKIGQRIFSENRPKLKEKTIFSLKKFQISEFHPEFCL